MFDIEGEDADGVKSDVERFVLDYKDGNLYRMCKEEASLGSQSTRTEAPSTSAMSDIQVTTPSNFVPTTSTNVNITTISPLTEPIQVTVAPNELVNEINSSNVTENVRFFILSLFKTRDYNFFDDLMKQEF